MRPSLRTHRPSSSPRCSRRGTALSGCALTVMSPFALEYVVQPGDTASDIAAQRGTTVERLVEANDLPADGNRIYAGETLRVPAAHPQGHRDTASDAVRDTRSTATASPDDGRRRIVWHRVRPGDTMTGIAERYHAWTDELIDANGGTDHLVVGERVRVPVVVSRADAAGDRRPGPAAATGRVGQVQRLRTRLSGYPDPSRAEVRRIIERVAEREGVDADLALAVSWQEAGWRQHHVSADAAVGAMQVIPSTGEWASAVVGRDLNLLRVRHNVTAGVVLLDHLTDAANTRRAVAGYYQGLAGVREHGMYDDTRAYVDNVMALRGAFARGHEPHPG